ncbi:hypothetical protein G6556_11655, partial [Cellulomonas sp. IC4_254]|nr:hypothetical protein [Cellulomonas sp. IC4_254]
LRRPAVLAVVAALLAPLLLVTGAPAAFAADPVLTVTGFTVTSGATAQAAPPADPEFGFDAAYTASPAAGTVSSTLGYRCAGDESSCEHATMDVVLDALRLTQALDVSGLGATVEYWADAVGGTTTTDATAAAAFSVRFTARTSDGLTGLQSGVSGDLRLSTRLVAPAAGGTQTGTITATPTATGGAGTKGRIRVTGEFPVNLATSTQVTWAREGWLSGVEDGADTPTNSATVVGALTGDPADSLTLTWGGTDPAAAPAAGTVGMLTDLTGLAIASWPAGAATATVTGWTWSGSGMPAPVAVGTVTGADAEADLLAGLDAGTRSRLTGLRVVFAAAAGGLVASGSPATLRVDVREHLSQDATPVTRTGAKADYVTAGAASFSAAADMNTLTVTGTATTRAARGAATSAAVADTRGLRIYDPRAYAGSATALTGLSTPVYGGGFVRGTAAGTNWSRRAVEALVVEVPATAAQVAATNAALDPDLPALANPFGAGLSFAGFGAARGTGAGRTDSADGSGVVVQGLTGPARLELTVLVGTVEHTVDLDAAAPAVPTDPAAFGLGSWSEVTGFRATVHGTGAAVPMGASVTLPYLARTATASTAATYAVHTVATTRLGTDTSAVTPRTQASGNRPVTAATVSVAVPTVDVAGTKYVAEPYVTRSAGATVNAVLEATARPLSGGSGHLPDTLTLEDSAAARTAQSGGIAGTAWWTAFAPTSVETTVPAGGSARLQYYTADDPQWVDFTGGTTTDLGDTATWRGVRVVVTRPGGGTFANNDRARVRITFALRDGVSAGTWADGADRTNVAQITSSAAIEGFVVTSPVRRVSDTVQMLGGTGGAGYPALVKTMDNRDRTEGNGDATTATLTWGTGGQDLSTATVTDANGVTGAQQDPATGPAHSFYDTFDLAGVQPITSGPTASGVYDPYLVFDRVTDVRVFDVVDDRWESLATRVWTGSAWTDRTNPAAARSDVAFGGAAAQGAFPYAGSFPGMSVQSSTLRARIGGVQLVYAARPDSERQALAASDWRRGLLGTLTTGAVASTDAPARKAALTFALRDTSRATGEPVNDAYTYTGSAPGAVENSGAVTGTALSGGALVDLGGPVNPVGERTVTVQPASLGATATKTWLRDANGSPLTGSSNLHDLALPVDPSTAPDSAWPTATLTATAASASGTRVDQLVLTEPRGIDTATSLDEDAPFAAFAVTDVRELTDASGLPGATAVEVVVYERAADNTLTHRTVPRAELLDADEAALADVVGLQVRYTGRIAWTNQARLVLGTRLLAHDRVTGEVPEASAISGQGEEVTVANVAEATVTDARVCAAETRGMSRTPTCAPGTASGTARDAVTLRGAQLEAFPTVTVSPVDVQRDAATPAITSTLSVQNFGLTPADQLLLTDADPRYFNAVDLRTVAVQSVPSGVERAELEVLVAGPDLEIAADGTYTGTQAWQAWAAVQPTGTFDLAVLAPLHGARAADVVGVRLRFLDTDGSTIPAPGQGYGRAVLTGTLREELRTGGLPSAVGADGWRYQGRAELTANPGETARGTISNSVTAQALRADLGSQAQSAGPVGTTVHAGAATLQVQKTELDAASRAPGDFVRYRIAVANTASGANAADLTGLVVTDRLPEDGSLVHGTAPEGQAPVVVQAAGGGASPLGDPTVTAADGVLTLTFPADSRLAPGAAVEVLLWVRIATDLSTTSIVNTATAASASRPVQAAPTGNDGGTACTPGSYDAATAACLARAAAVTIGGANVYVSEEWVRDAAGTQGAVRTTAPRPGQAADCAPRGTGAGDRDWYRFPCSVVTTAGSTTQWQVQVTSRATISTDRLEMISMLPTTGDYPAMDGTASGSRGSQWRPVWDGVVPGLVTGAGLPSGATVAVYTTTADYRQGGLAPSGAFDPVPSTWSSTPLTPGQRVPAAQAARVTGFKLVVSFTSADRFSSGESVRVQWAMRTPLSGAPAAADTWGSFAFRVPSDAAAGRPADVTSVPLKAGARFALAAAGSDPLVAVGDRVWLDADRDGRQSEDVAAEPGVPGVTVDVLDVAGGTATYVASAVTDADGDWLVDGLPAGTYDLAYTLPDALAAQYRYTRVGVGSDDTVDSDAVVDPDAPASAVDAGVVLGAGGAETTAVGSMPQAWQDAHPDLVATQVDVSHDAGLQWRPLAVGDRVWFDADRDGRQGAGEAAVEGATVRLLGAGDAVLATTVTGADGSYVFDALDPGTYRVEVELPDSLAQRWTFTSALVGDAAGDSDVVAATPRLGRTAAFTLTPGAAGLTAVSALAGDPAWAGADADAADPTRDAGLAELPARVGDRVWVDVDGDGVQDAGEPGLAGVVLTLADAQGDPVTDAAGAPVGPVTTDADGAYAFTGLLPGAYTVTVDEAASAAALAPYRPTVTGAGDAATDSAAGSASTAAPLVGGQADDTLDFGFRPLWALGDRVWLDSDRDGVQGAGEPSFPGVAVRLLDATDAEVASTVTDTDGRWRFDLLEPGAYRVELELSGPDAARYTWTTARSAAAPRADADSDAEETAPGVARTPVITVGAGTAGVRPATAADGLTAAYVDDTWDTGLVERPVAVGDLVWFDADLDGLQGPDEEGVPGVVVELRTTDGHAVTDASGAPVGPVTTDADGAYAFAGLLPGEYVVRLDRIASAAALAGYAPTVAGAGSDPALDSATWTATSRVLVGGESDPTLDFGLVLADDVQLALRKVPVARTADSVTWDVTVMSTGTQDAYAGFTVVDALPGSLTFRSASGTGFDCVAVDRVVTCDHDSPLPAGESATVRIVTGLTAAGAEVTNTATVSVDGRGYRFDVLAADDVAWSEPAARTGGATGTAPGGDLATTGSDAAWPLVAAGALLALGAALLATASRGSGRRVRAAGSRHRA